MAGKRPFIDEIDSRELLMALRAFKRGDFSVRLPLDQTGLAGEIYGAHLLLGHGDRTVAIQFGALCPRRGSGGLLGIVRLPSE
jgi:hypothetical protein